jgi:hypothetical protein
MQVVTRQGLVTNILPLAAAVLAQSEQVQPILQVMVAQVVQALQQPSQVLQ